MEQTREGQIFNYEQELQVLQDMILQPVSSLLTDTASIVKQTFLHSSLTKLCIFLGKQKSKLRK